MGKTPEYVFKQHYYHVPLFEINESPPPRKITTTTDNPSPCCATVSASTEYPNCYGTFIHILHFCRFWSNPHTSLIACGVVSRIASVKINTTVRVRVTDRPCGSVRALGHFQELGRLRGMGCELYVEIVLLEGYTRVRVCLMCCSLTSSTSALLLFELSRDFQVAV